MNLLTAINFGESFHFERKNAIYKKSSVAQSCIEPHNCRISMFLSD